MKRSILASLLLLTSAALPGPALAAQASLERPPYVGGYEPQGVDERGLWMDIDEYERILRDSPMVVHDSQLSAFVKDVTCKSVGDDRCGALRIYILQDSSFNAAMYPNGLMVVHTGLLARLHSEAELAAVVAHEFGHFESRHGLKQFIQLRKATDMQTWLAIVGASFNINISSLQTSIAAGYYAFGRDLESEADTLSAKIVLGSPYRLRASEVWQRATEEQEALRVERGLKPKKKVRPDFADTHPTNVQRQAYFTKLETDAGGRGEDGVESYRVATSRVLPLLFAALVKGNDFGSSDYVIKSRGDALGWDGQLLQMRAELFRQRANPRDLVTARELFQQSIAQPDAPAESWRGLGLSAMRLGDNEAGRSALAEYLKRAPDAKDAQSIKALLEN